jgi:hypothetical protein
MPRFNRQVLRTTMKQNYVNATQIHKAATLLPISKFQLPFGTKLQLTMITKYYQTQIRVRCNKSYYIIFHHSERNKYQRPWINRNIKYYSKRLHHKTKQIRNTASTTHIRIFIMHSK